MNYPDQTQNPARMALTRAVNRAIAEGYPIYVNQPAQLDNDAIERKRLSRIRANVNRKAREQAMRDCGLVKVRGALGGVYWE